MSKPKQPPAEPALGAGMAHTFRQGSSLVTIVTDGYISVPEAVVTVGADPIAREAMTYRLPKVANGVLAEANIPIVKTGSDVIVVDVGGGGRYQPTEGQFVGNLHAAGIAASTVTKVVLTHAHPDHVWGIQDENGAAFFPDATLYQPAVTLTHQIGGKARDYLRLAGSSLYQPFGGLV